MSYLRDQRSGVTWTNALVLYGSAASDYFGYALAISNDYHLAISAYGSQGQRVGQVRQSSEHRLVERTRGLAVAPIYRVDGDTASLI